MEFKFVGELPGAGLDPELAETDDSGHAAAIVRLASVLVYDSKHGRVVPEEDP